MANPLTVREATVADLPVLRGFGSELARLHISYDARRFRFPPDLEGAHEQFFSRQLGQPHAAVLLAVRAGQPCGYAFVRVEDASFVDATDRTAWLHDLYVDPSARAEGVGRRLLDEALVAGRKLGAGGMMLTVAAQNLPAQKLFVGMGFRTTMFEMRFDSLETPG